MPNTDRKQLAEITDSLNEIKEYCNRLCSKTEAIQHDVESLKKERRMSAERISDKLDGILIDLRGMIFILQNLTAPDVLCGFKIRHPEIIDTTPVDVGDEVTSIANDIEKDVDKKCEELSKKMKELADGRDSAQYLSDCVSLLKRMRNEIVSRRSRVEALRKRRRNMDKDSNEQKNAAILTVKVKSIIAPLEKFTDLVLDSYFAKRKRLMSEIWRTTVAIEELYDSDSHEFKNRIPHASDNYKISSAIRDLSKITTRHEETNKANVLVASGNMSALERRRLLAGLKN